MSNNLKATRQTTTGQQYHKNLNANLIKKSLSSYDFYRYELPDLKLKSATWNDGGLCPFHADNKPGSFRVNLSTGAFKCFSCAASGGDILAFTMALHGLNFIEALRKLVDDWGLAW